MGVKQVIVIRKDLNMRKGKMIAQGAHASMKVLLDKNESKNRDRLEIPISEDIADWVFGNFRKIVVYVNSEQELLNIYNKAKDKNLICSIIEDNGLTEFNGIPTLTAVAIGPANEDSINEITGNLPLL